MPDAVPILGWSRSTGSACGRREGHNLPAGLPRLGSAIDLGDDEQARIILSAPEPSAGRKPVARHIHSGAAGGQKGPPDRPHLHWYAARGDIATAFQKGVFVAKNWFRGVMPDSHKPVEIDTSVAHSARVYNYLLGGKDNFAADREAGDRMMAALPNVVSGSRMNRAFLARAVRFLVTDCEIRQFLDIGTGIPSANNTHEVAQAIAQHARIVYVDNDPIVLTHARALLTSTHEGAVAYLDADLRQPDDILQAAARTLDFREPIALMMLMVLHMVPDADKPHQIVGRLLDALPAGSYLVLSHPPSDILPEGVAEVQRRFNQSLGQGASMTARSRGEVARFFEGLEIVEPGLVQVHQWRPDGELDPNAPASIWCAVGRKP